MNHATLRVRSDELVGAVLSRVVGMLAARAQCPIDRLDDALLVSDAIAAHAPSFTLNGTVEVAVIAEDGALVLRVGPLRAQGAQGLLEAVDLPGVGNVLERVADQLSTEPAGEDGAERLVIRLDFGT